ncbi:acetylcholinesterase-1 [Caerostris extrusa]|uniref:Carboxylic ester hydrolase n=1 Tax=Caerostris extrusa TaxID=172846 RepID=A0AAV4UJJ2_CAEEX|nr:acetylcholinesterase-1 [Caerostris extrusa]
MGERQYREYFGGDKNRITLHGQSAGSIAISLLCVSPLTKGLFSKAIMESGSAIFLKYNQLQPNLQLSQRLAKAVNCASDDNTIEDDPDGVVGCLREILVQKAVDCASDDNTIEDDPDDVVGCFER